MLLFSNLRVWIEDMGSIDTVNQYWTVFFFIRKGLCSDFI